MNTKKAWIISGGPLKNPEFYRNALEFASPDMIIAADSGFDNAQRIGILPHIVIGDMDSTQVCDFGSIPVQKHPADKDKTDTHLAVDYALTHDCREIVLICALDGADGHAFANVFLLDYIANQGAHGEILSEQSQIFLVTGFWERLRVHPEWGHPSQKVTLLPLTSSVDGVTTQGLLYPLCDATLHRGDTLGVSNQFVDEKAEITIKSGRLLVIIDF